MKNFKFLTIAIVVALAFAVAGCSGVPSVDEIITAENIGEYIELGEYKGLEYSIPVPEVTQQEIDDTVASILSSSTALEEVEGRPAETGDTLVIDYVGTLDGVAFDGGTAQGSELTLGSGLFIEGFEDGLIGAEKGEQRSLDLTFPDPYPNNEDLAGQAVVFDVTVQSINQSVTPELTDEFVFENFQYETIEEFLEYIEFSILYQKQSESAGVVVDQILQEATENATFLKLPENAIYNYNQSIIAEYEAYATQANLQLSDVITSLTGMSEEEFLEALEADTEEIFKQRLVLEAIGFAENITITDEEYESGIELIASQLNYPSVEDLLGVVTEDELRKSLINDKALTLMMENAVDLSTDDLDDLFDDVDDDNDTVDDTDDVDNDVDDVDNDVDDVDNDVDDVEIDDDVDDVDDADDVDDIDDDTDDVDTDDSDD